MLSNCDIIEFISANDVRFDNKLSSFFNYSRVVSLANFSKMINLLDLSKQYSVGVISGSENEPELKFIDYHKLEVVNFDHDAFYDLDKDWSARKSHNFSMVLCNQVLEHVFNPHIAFRNLCHEAAAGGYIYVTIPTINCIHGEPYFYSSGFHPRFLRRLGQENKLEILEIGWWGSYRYMIDAVSGNWSTQKQLQDLRNCSGIDFVRTDIAVDGTLIDTGENPVITDCWALYRKPQDHSSNNFLRRTIRNLGSKLAHI